VLAELGQKKLDREKRIAVIRDCTPFKQWELSSPDEQSRQHRNRSMLRRHFLGELLSQHASIQPAGELHIHLARPLECIMLFLGLELGYHPDQLHLAEFAAVKAREKLFHIDLDIDARNTVVHKAQQMSRCTAEEEAEPTPKRARMEFEDVGGQHIDDMTDDLELLMKTAKGFLMDPDFNVRDIRSLLTREAEVEAARHPTPGQTKESYKQMLGVADVFEEAMERFMQPGAPVESSARVHFGVDFEGVLREYQDSAEAYRKLRDGSAELPIDDSVDNNSCFAAASLFELDLVMQGPVAVAKHLVDSASLNEDQKRPVALVAARMQQKWEETRAAFERSGCDAAFNNKVESSRQRGEALLPTTGVILRLVLVGGGGCGKSRIINKVLSPLLTCYDGDKGVLREAGSNKAARLIDGVTLHMANGLQGNSSLLTPHLRLSAENKRKAEHRYGPLGAKIFDECSQYNARLWHADCYRTAAARDAVHDGVQFYEYADPEHTWGDLPIVIVCGDELQLPPVPAEAGLFALIEGRSHEQKVGVKIFSGFHNVYRLTTAMRFNQEIHISILQKMRTRGGCGLSMQEWAALERTEVQDPSRDLTGTDDWYQASYLWSVVTMAIPIRSQLSANRLKRTLFVVQARDEYVSYLDTESATLDFSQQEMRRDVARAVLAHPCMNETGRLPAFAMFHIGMSIRLTLTSERQVAVTDATGVIKGIEFDDREPRRHTEAASKGDLSMVTLLYLPKAVYVELDTVEGASEPPQWIKPRACPAHVSEGVQPLCERCQEVKKCIVVPAMTNPMPWSIEVETRHIGKVKVKVKRTQVPVLCVKASTLHVLQGTTCDPGLIFHWTLPNRLSLDQKWLAVYVALSRVRNLNSLRSIGLKKQIRKIIEQGPPEELMTQFDKYFGDKEVATLDLTRDLVSQLGWQ